MSVRILPEDQQRTFTGVLDRWAGQPAGFNRPAAEAVYQAVAGCPDDESARLAAVMILDGMIQHELITKGHQLARAADDVARARADVLRKRLARTAVRKAARHEDSRGELEGLALLAKAGFDFTDEERERYARARHRDLATGRFVREHKVIDYDPRFGGLSEREARRLGIPEEAPSHFSARDRARFQEAYHQIAQTVRPFLGMGDGALIHLHVHDAQGPQGTRLLEMPNTATQPLRLGDQLKRGEHVAAVSVSVVPPTTAAGAAFDALAPLSPTVAGAVYHAAEHGALNTERLSEYRGDLGRKFDQDAYIPSQRVFRNIASTSHLLEDSLGDIAPPKLKLALKLGRQVGTYGPEAQKVIGPTADKAAYRYRGTERALPEPLRNAIAQLSTLDIKDKAWYLVHGNARPDGEKVPGGWNPSGVLQQFRAMLPKADLNDLHLKSGAVPPSRGVVFDKDGHASVLAVGYGDDHYLPFNLRGKSFRSMRGGEYIRTRTFGGPTTEDIYASLMGGARRFAVVSHNGVFTVDYADDLKGGKRFNDNAHRMVARYGYLLDAVQSKQVTTGGLSNSRRRELEALAEQKFPEARYPDKYADELERLTAHEIKHPQMSQQQKDRAALDFFSRVADLGPGAGGLRQTVIANYINAEAGDRWAKARAERDRIVREYPDAGSRMPPPPSLESFQSQVQDEISGLHLDQQAKRYATALGMGDQFDLHMKQAEEDNKARLTPLALNGAGYEKALQALQEEFPHYIVATQFHPWSESNPAGRKDTGYVRPRHNRAANALSGYFDSVLSSQGRGKVHADSTRWQNRNDKLRPYETETERTERKKTEQAKPGMAKPDTGTAAALREDADFAFFDEIKAQTAFAADHKAVGSPSDAFHADAGSLKNYSIASALEDERGRLALEAAAPDLMNLWRMPKEEFEAAYRADPNKMRATMARAKGQNDRLGLLSVKASVAATFDRGGKPAPSRALPEHASQALGDAGDTEYDFDEPAYAASASPRTGMIAAEYGSNDLIRRLVDARALPESVSDPDFDTKAEQLHAALTEQRRVLMSRLRSGEQIPDEAWRLVDEPAEGLIRARQLRRRHDRAAEAEREPRLPVGDEPPPLVNQTLEIHAPKGEGESAEEWVQRQADLMEEIARRQQEEREETRRRGLSGSTGVIDA